MRFFMFLLFSCVFTFPSLAFDEWLHSAGSFKSERYSSIDQITKENIQNLELAWTFNSGQFNKKDTVQTSPIFTGKFLINVTIDGDVIAIDPISGNEVWSTKLAKPVGRRGITFDDFDNPSIYVPTAEGVVSLDESTGEIIKIYNTGKSLLAPILTTNQLTVATLNDGIKAFDRISGKQIWHFSLEERSKNASKYTPRIWSGFSYDTELNIYYIVTGNPGELVGVNRTKPDLSVSLIAVSGDTGDLLWYFQHIEHDVWDFDLVGPPIITSTKILNNGKKIVIALSKTGEVIVLDAVSGDSVYDDSISRIEVPSSDIKGENSAKYQKIISIPEPFSGIKININEDFNHLDDKNKEYVLKKIRHSKSGIYLPPSLNYDLITYGLHGGAEWPGGSLNLSSPNNPSLVIPFNQDPWILRIFYQNTIFRIIEKISIYLVSVENIFSKFFNYFSEKTVSNLLHKKSEVTLGSSEKCSGEDESVGLESLNCSESARVYDNKIIRTPWAQNKRKDEIANSIFSKMPIIRSTNRLYNEQCSSCHGEARQGKYQSEFDGDLFYPPLVGITLTDKYLLSDTKKEFEWLHEDTEASKNFTDKEYKELFDYFKKYDERLLKLGLLRYTYHWQQLLDRDGYPATSPPWGGIASVDLNSGKLSWKKPFGLRKSDNNMLIANGDKNFGGVLSTSSDIIFAGGTPDEMVRAFDGKTGEIIWERVLPFAASAPPISYLYKSCQYIVINATGGRFHGFINTGDATVAYKLDTCVNSE